MEKETKFIRPGDMAETYTKVSSLLENLFDGLNGMYFNSMLEKPVITIQSTPKAYGHFTLNDTWHVWDGSKEEKKKELNIGAGTIDRPIYEVAATLLHEMVHLYNYIHGVKDVSSNGMYHNKKFKEEAEKRGLVIEKHGKYGWTVTHPSGSLCMWLDKNGFTDIRMGRIENWKEDTGSSGGNVKKKCSTRKYQCCICGISVRATKEVRIKCIDCDMEMEVQ